MTSPGSTAFGTKRELCLKYLLPVWSRRAPRPSMATAVMAVTALSNPWNAAEDNTVEPTADYPEQLRLNQLAPAPDESLVPLVNSARRPTVISMTPGDRFPLMNPEQADIIDRTAARSQKPPQEEVCVECAMRDEEMADVDVTSPGVWDRESDVWYEELVRKEREDERQGVQPSTSRPRAKGHFLTEHNVKLWLSMVCLSEHSEILCRSLNYLYQNPREAAARDSGVRAY